MKEGGGGVRTRSDPPPRLAALKPGLRWLRLRSVWILVVAFLFFASPTPWALAAGAGLAVVGALIRAWAAGTIRKDRELATRGPYAFTRNPLYLGSFFIGTGVTLAGGRPVFVVLFLVFFALVYGATMRRESRELEERFGEAFRDYRARVPLFRPRLTPYAPPGGTGEGIAEAGAGAPGYGFDPTLYRKNREWEAALGVVAGFAVLAVKMVLL